MNRPTGESGEPDPDEALSWAGDEDRLLVSPAQPASETSARVGAGGVMAEQSGDPSGEVSAGVAGEVAGDSHGANSEQGTSGLGLVAYGVIAGLSLLMIVGWVTAVRVSTVTMPDLVSEVMYQFGEFLAIAGPALWFVAVLVLARRASTARRIVWHLIGLVVTAPWPLMIAGLG